MTMETAEQETKEVPPRQSREENRLPSLALSPTGKLYWKATSALPEERVHWDQTVLSRIERAFEKGSGEGLFWLGSHEVNTALPPVFARWHEFSRLFMHQLCMLSDEEGNSADFEMPWPEQEARQWLASAPVMTGAEYLTEDTLRGLWSEMTAAFHRAKAIFPGRLQLFLQRLHPVWNQVGRVHLHLAENKQSPETPFAFLATYTPYLAHPAQGSRVQHLPLSQALQEYAGAKNKTALLSLLRPLQKGASQSPWLKELVDSGDIYQPMAWTPGEACSGCGL